MTLSGLLGMVNDPYLLKMGCEVEAILGPKGERLGAFEHIIFRRTPYYWIPATRNSSHL
jgi:hypothetical protein